MVTRRLAPTAIVLALVLLLGVVPASSSPDSLRRGRPKAIAIGGPKPDG